MLELARRATGSPLPPALLLASTLAFSSPALAATILTFDISGGVTNFQLVPQAYGDSVSASPDGAGHVYGGDPDFSPALTVAYGAPGEDPNLWTAGYGDLVNVYFNDQDSDTTLTLTLTGEPGFNAVLLGFDIASFSPAGQMLPGFDVLDAQGGTLFSQESTFVPGATSGGHTTVDFGPGGLEAKVVSLVLDLTGLGMQSDNIGIDNVVIAQTVPEPGPAPLIAIAVLAGAAWRRVAFKH